MMIGHNGVIIGSFDSENGDMRHLLSVLQALKKRLFEALPVLVIVLLYCSGLSFLTVLAFFRPAFQQFDDRFFHLLRRIAAWEILLETIAGQCDLVEIGTFFF